ncbi:BatD family protein [Shewanella corallii]|uniref:BatD family protein n=1 Tax=Shewanella corallii TaxID=560080 RepID=A0ABT0NA72_9GAMM|nr:BatD family protein [Shewanella corallii]
MVKRAIFLFLFMLLIPSAAMAAVTKVDASVDKNPVMDGEYFVLTVSANDNLDAQALDTSALSKDFVVGRTSVGRSTQIVNFDTSKQTNWQILLAPKATGTFTIPAFTIDGVKSQPIQLKVVASGSQSSQSKLVFIDASLSAKEVYVGQLALYRVKLYLGADLQRGVLNAPTLNGAELKQLGEDQDQQEIVDGKRYRVIERTYGITPSQAGTLAIGPATFQGDVVMNSAGNRDSLFGFGFGDSRMVQAVSKELTVNVLPKPAHYQGKWLVADLVSLNDVYGEDTQYQVGTPITRTVTLLASNAEDTALADLEIPVPEGFKAYPEKAQRENIVRNGQLVAKLTQTIAMVPSKAGNFTLPEVRVPWWNPHLRKQEWASLPAEAIEVSAAVGQPQLPVFQPDGQAAVEASQPQPMQPVVTHAGFWPWLTGIFALLWLITLVLWRRTVTSNEMTLSKAQDIDRPVSSSGKGALTQACRQQAPEKVLSTLQQYVSSNTGQEASLADIAARYPELRQVIDSLQAARYSREGKNLDFDAILNAILAVKLTQKNSAAIQLAPLNP